MVTDPSLRFGRILVRGVNWLGDAVMTTPALLRLRAAHPHSRLGLLTPRKLAGLWERHPAIDEVVTFDADEGIVSVARRVRAGAWDTGLILPNSPRSVLEMWLGGVPRRVGYATPWRRWWLTTAVPAPGDSVPMRKRSAAEVRRLIRGAMLPDRSGRAIPAGAHHTRHYLRLAAALGADPQPRSTCVVVGVDEVTSLRTRLGLSPELTWIGLNAGAEYGPAKRWPVDRFLAVARVVMERPSTGVVLLGGPGDVALVAPLAAELVRGGVDPRRVVLLAGRTSLRELAAALAACATVVTNDTGPMHLAAALGTPVVAVFGSTEPGLTAPGLAGDPRHALLRARAPCAPCYLRVCPVDFRCMNDIAVNTVVEAVNAALARPTSRPDYLDAT